MLQSPARRAVVARARAPCCYAGLVGRAVRRGAGRLLPWLAGRRTLPLPAAARGGLHASAINVFGFFAVALLSGSLAEGCARADAQLEQASIADRRPAGVQPARHRQPDERPRDDRRRRRGADVQPGGRGRSPGDPARRRSGATLGEVLQLPRELDGARSGREPARPRAAARRATRTARRRRGDRASGLSAAPLRHAGRRDRARVHVPGRHRVERLERDARLQQRLAAVGEMAAGIAHEIRNPLASMSRVDPGAARRSSPLIDEQAQLMDIVLRESERLNETIRTFLAYARPQRGAGDARRRARACSTRRRAAAQQRRASADDHASRSTSPADDAVVRGRREPDPADRLEPRDQRPAGDAARRARCGWRCGSSAAGRAARRASCSGRGRGRRHRVRGPRRHLPAVPQRVRARHRPRPGDRAPHRERLRRGRSQVASAPRARGTDGQRCACRSRQAAAAASRWPPTQPERLAQIATVDVTAPAPTPADAPRADARLARARRRRRAVDARAAGDRAAPRGLRRDRSPRTGARRSPRSSGGRFDLLVSDIRMPDMSGVEVLRAAKQRDPDIVGDHDDRLRVARRPPSRRCGSARATT